ncbi:phage tail protein I, partial [Pseudomonas aeruginosa]
RVPIPLRQLWNPTTCPVALLPYLAWAFSVDRWDSTWPERVKRQVIRDAYLVHSHKGTLSALRRVVEPVGSLTDILEWWQQTPAGVPGTFEITVDVSDNGLDEETVLELERLLDDVRPVSRHLTRLDLRITPDILARHGLATIDGDTLEISPWKQ